MVTERKLRFRTFGVALSIGMLIAGCGSDAAVQKSDGAPDRAGTAEQFAQELLDADRAFNDRTETEGVEGWVAAFAEDGRLFRGGGGIAEGPEAIRQAMAALSDPNFSLSWEPEVAEASVTGDLGYTLGSYRSRVVGPDGNEVVSTGQYVTVWRRDPNGEWKVVLDIGNPDQPPPPPR